MSRALNGVCVCVCVYGGHSSEIVTTLDFQSGHSRFEFESRIVPSSRIYFTFLYI